MSSYTYKITHSFQWAALALIIACFSCIVLPALLSDGYTYSLASTDNCAKSVIVVDVVDFIVCCDPGKTTAGQQGLCIAAYDSTIKIFTSMYAYVIPFLPIFISSILYYNRCMLQSALVRARFLVILLLYRTVSTSSIAVCVLHVYSLIICVDYILCSFFCTSIWTTLSMSFFQRSVIVRNSLCVGTMNTELANLAPNSTPATTLCSLFVTT